MKAAMRAAVWSATASIVSVPGGPAFSVCDMAAFAGSARFTGLDAVGPTKTMTEVDLVQHAVQVAAPSPVWSLSQLFAKGFEVA
jgi:hypothetical protein